MIKRLTWFTMGAVAGVTGSAYARRKVREAAGRLAPDHVARVTLVQARRRGGDLVAAVREGRAAMAAKEDELWAGVAAQAELPGSRQEAHR
jgi:hypothetical protein